MPPKVSSPYVRQFHPGKRRTKQFAKLSRPKQKCSPHHPFQKQNLEPVALHHDWDWVVLGFGVAWGRAFFAIGGVGGHQGLGMWVGFGGGGGGTRL